MSIDSRLRVTRWLKPTQIQVWYFKIEIPVGISLSLVSCFSVMTAPKKGLGHRSAHQKMTTQKMTSKRLGIELPSDELATAEHNLNDVLATVNHHKTELEAA